MFAKQDKDTLLQNLRDLVSRNEVKALDSALFNYFDQDMTRR